VADQPHWTVSGDEPCAWESTCAPPPEPPEPCPGCAALRERVAYLEGQVRVMEGHVASAREFAKDQERQRIVFARQLTEAEDEAERLRGELRTACNETLEAIDHGEAFARDIERLIEEAEANIVRALSDVLNFTEADLAEIIEGGDRARSGAAQVLEAIGRRLSTWNLLNGPAAPESSNA
jgi:hypothetical protein